jgi:hypothetical protein
VPIRIVAKGLNNRVTGTQKAQPARRDTVTCQDWGATDATKRQTEIGNLPPGPQNQQLNNQLNERATILFGR